MDQQLDQKQNLHNNFTREYNKLNASQKKAVDLIDGPVLVIAGPGTGKTQILAVRISNILLLTDTDPKSILCLTFTDAGAQAMRNRLQSFIGAAAYDVGIYTFHSFCNMIIKQHPDEFQLYGEFDLISDLEKNQLISDLIHEVTLENELYNFKQNYQYEIFKLSKFFDQIKKENWNADDLKQRLNREIIDMRTDEKYIYKRNSGTNKPGDLKINDYNKDVKKLNKTIAALDLYVTYLDKMEQMERYDYNDMIQWLVRKFQSDEGFLSKFQEKYLYLLVDEYQDTNGSQNEIIYSLCAHQDQPNIFVVGDDDQSIYRFQGANMDNMFAFRNRFKPTTIVLTDNYRSSQDILDKSGALIANNSIRLINYDNSLTKDLKAAGINTQYQPDICLSEYTNLEAEVTGVIMDVQHKIAQGIPANEIAILYKKHNDIDPYIKLLQAKKISYYLARDVDVLHELIINQLIQLLEFFSKSQKNALDQDELLYPILMFPYIDIPTLDVSRIAFYRNRKETQVSLIETLGDTDYLQSIKISDPKKCNDLQQKLINLIKDYTQLTPQIFIEKMLHELNIISFIINTEDKFHLLNILNRFYQFIKEESKRDPDQTINSVMDKILLMKKNKIILPLHHAIGNPMGIKLMTLYKSKGLEFDSVYMIHNTSSKWNSLNKPLYKLPTSLQHEDADSDEDLRRVFYVGMTRAKQSLNISYHVTSIGSKANVATKFISEIVNPDNLEIVIKQAEQSDIANMVLAELSYMRKDHQQMDDLEFNIFLEKFRLNPTALDKYMSCPIAFYYENVLSIPSGRTAYFGYGKAVHDVLHQYLWKYHSEAMPDKFTVDTIFDKSMAKFKSHFTSKEFDSYLQGGKDQLLEFLNHHWQQWRHTQSFEFEKKYKESFYNTVPISGQIDRIDRFEKNITVIDYKTGSAAEVKKKTAPPSEKEPTGSSYWRQMVFYAILLDQQSEFKNLEMTTKFYFVQKHQDKFETAQITPTQGDKELVGDMIVDTYNKIKNKIFTPGCGDEHCNWCQYINSGAIVRIQESEDDQID